MPTAPPTRCTDPTCRDLATSQGRCAQHQRAPWQTRSRHWDQIDRRRWGKARKRQLDAHPNCWCGAAADQVDHIIPIAEGGAIWNPANHQSLCWDHHDAKTRAENARANKRRAKRTHRP